MRFGYCLAGLVARRLVLRPEHEELAAPLRLPILLPSGMVRIAVLFQGKLLAEEAAGTEAEPDLAGLRIGKERLELRP
ncbi:hypothetical protein [Verrucomicrobium sp. 3C]|uniref:hypothetical protein n=1 Tax=Verrucomicrobium sp. 3C TaxID=1134055 RepID=UPI00035CDC75|nr:hypothetical protein [Verrucomicrobium sp. 3C]